MSRNFELLRQVEVEPEKPESTWQSSYNRATSRRTSSDNPCLSSKDEISRLVQTVFLSGLGSLVRTIVICSVSDDEASSSICASIGIALAANSSKPVCMIDANMRSLRLSNRVQTKPSIFSPFRSSSIRDQCTELAENLWLANHGVLSRDGTNLVSMDELRDRWIHLKNSFNYILIDAPGTSISSDALTLAQISDAVILVIEANKTRRIAALKAKNMFDVAGVRLLGTILNNRTLPIPESVYRRL